MAASGINEHNEACRKQTVVNRQAHLKQILLNKYGGYKCEERPQLQGECARSRILPRHQDSLYSHHPSEELCREHNMLGTDQKCGKMNKQLQYVTYTAKINGRFTSTNYCQQW